MSSINYLICQQCQKNIPLITIFFDIKGLKIEYKCKCMNNYNIIKADEFLKIMHNKNTLIKGNCTKDKNHINIIGQAYCYTCNKVLCDKCEYLHFVEFEHTHKTITNDINKVLNNKKNLKKQNIDENDFKELEQKIKVLKEFTEINNIKIYNEIINDINENKDTSMMKYKRIITKSFNFNKDVNDLVYSLFNVIKINYIYLKEYNLEEPFKNLFSNFIINEKTKIFLENNDSNKNKNVLNKISLYNEYFLNNFIIKKKLIYPHISCISTCKGHTSSIDCIVQLYDGRIATGSSDGSVKIWSQKDYSLIATLKNENSEPIYSIHQMKNNCLIYGTEDGNFFVWDINTYQNITFIKGSHLKSIWGFMDVGSNKIVSISEDKTFKVWNIHNFKLIIRININGGMILSEWTAEDGSLITGLENGKIIIWDMDNYTCSKELNGHIFGVDYIIQLKDYRIVSGAQDMYLKVWDYFTGENLATLKGHEDTVESLLELKDTRVVSASWDKTLRVWDIYNYQCLLTINAHDDYILVIELLKDGKFISGSSDTNLKIWEPRYNGNQIIKIVE